MKNCKLCKKRFKNIEQDNLCESCQNDLSDSSAIRKATAKRHAIRKDKQYKSKKPSKQKVQSSAISRVKSEGHLIKKFSYIIRNRQITNNQYLFLSYLENQTALHDDQKNILAEIYSLSYNHLNDTLARLQDKYMQLGIKEQQIFTLLQYIEVQAPITVPFNPLKDLVKVTNTEVFGRNAKGFINICNNLAQNGNNQQGSSESYLIMKAGVRKRCLLNVQSRHSKIRKVTLQFSKYLLNVISNSELCKAIQGLQNQDIDVKYLGIRKQVDILGEIRLDRDIERICVSCRETRSDTISLLNNIQHTYGVPFQIFQS